MVGASICRALQAQGFDNVLSPAHKSLDLLNQQATMDFFQREKPEFVFLAAARVGGINANNSYPANFIYENIMIESNVIHSAYTSSVRRLLFLGSSCIYPKFAQQPIQEDSLLTASLELSNEPYAIAKIAGIKLCESYNRQYGTNFRSIMPTNLYGEGDNFHLENSHVVPALIRKFHTAKENRDEAVTLWGSGSPRREFLYVDDLASACLFFMQLSEKDLNSQIDPRNSHINIGCAEDIAIKELAGLIQEIVGFEGRINWDSSMPDGTPRKLLDVSLAKILGWKSSVSLKEGLQKTYRWFLDNSHNFRST